MTTEPTSLLTYKLTSTPSPLKITETGTLTIKVSPPKEDFSCKHIKFNIAYGDEPSAIFQDDPTATCPQELVGSL